MVKNLPAVQETQVHFLGQKMGSQRVGHDCVTTCGGLVAQSCPTLATPQTVAHQAPLSIGFSGKNTGMGYHFLL